MESKSKKMKADLNVPQAGSSDEKAPDSSENCLQKNKGGWPKGKKRKSKTPKDAAAPKQPLTGYIRYMNERRDGIRTEHPGAGFTDITRLLADEWSTLPPEKKKTYLDAAEQDKERYAREIDEYKQNAENKIVVTLPPPTLTIQKPTGPVVLQKIEKPADFSAEFDIPIFTEEFLEHNKVRETELRQLRKSNTDYEQQNAILQKHIENMRTAIDKLDNETSAQKANNTALQVHLDKLRSSLVQGFHGLSLPGGFSTASGQNIDTYMTQLHSMVQSGTAPSGLSNKARDIINRLDLPMN